MDREKVIKGLETIKQFFGYSLPSAAEMFDSYYGILNDALALLKEQEGTINELQNAYGYLQKQFFEVQDELLKEQEAVVRCKDCKFGKEAYDNMRCHKPGMKEYESDYHSFDWFCADGKRKEDS